MAYVVFANPSALPIDKTISKEAASTYTNNPPNASNNTAITLSAEQLKTLESLGIDPLAIPITLSQVQIDYFNQKLGEDRVKKIINGASVSPVDLFKARDCIKL